MKKLIKKFWWIPVIVLSIGSLVFGTITTVNNFQLREEIAVVQQTNEELEKENAEFEAIIAEKDKEIEKRDKEITELKKK